MRQVRLNTFETNSSSSHSFVITKLDERYSEEEMNRHIYVHKDGKYRIWSSRLEFGRSPFDILATFESKSRYAIAASNGKLVPQIEEIWRKYIPNFKSFEFDERYRVWDEAAKDYIEPEEPVYDYGYTDEYQIEGWLKYYNVSLEDFLTMKKYMVVVDGDESMVWSHIIRTGLLNTSLILTDSYKDHWVDFYNKEIKTEEEKANPDLEKIERFKKFLKEEDYYDEGC